MDVECNNVQNGDESKSTSCYGARHGQMLLLFILVIIAYGMRVNLSVGIVAMTDPTTNPGFKTYDWDDKDVVLSAFFWGYILPQIGAGHFAKRYGAKWFLMGAMLACSLFSILIPVMADLGSWGVKLCRALQGFAQGFMYPSVHSMLSKWVPLSERSRFGTFVYAGGPFGTVISMPVSAVLATSSLGWPSIFYVYGGCGIMWTIAWMYFGCDDPSKHTSLRPAERKFLESTINTPTEDETPTPWLSIFKSLPFWAILIAHSGQNWGFFTLLTEIPSYLNEILHFDMKENGTLSAAPYLGMWLLSLVFSQLGDYAINRKIFTVGVTRKILNSIGHYIPALALIGLGFAEHNVTLAIVLLILAVSINSATLCSFQVNHMDLSPTHAGALMGLTNGISNVLSIIAPLAVQYIVTGGPNVAEQWRTVFILAASIYIAVNTFYVIFASGEVQPWDHEVPENNDKSDEKTITGIDNGLAKTEDN